MDFEDDEESVDAEVQELDAEVLNSMPPLFYHLRPSERWRFAVACRRTDKAMLHFALDAEVAIQGKLQLAVEESSAELEVMEKEINNMWVDGWKVLGQATDQNVTLRHGGTNKGATSPSDKKKAFADRDLPSISNDEALEHLVGIADFDCLTV